MIICFHTCFLQKHSLDCHSLYVFSKRIFTSVNNYYFKRSYSTSAQHTAVIVSAVRTPIGSFGGALSSFSATQLGSFAAIEAVKQAGTINHSIINQSI